MKRYKIFFLFLFVISLSQSCDAQISIDTIVIIDTLDYRDRSENEYQPIGYPYRACVNYKQKNSISTIDSIRCDGKIIDKCNQFYYLIVKDQSYTIRLEGTFFDKFPAGYVMEYNRAGYKIAEGKYEVSVSKKIVRSCGYFNSYRYSKKIGIWKYYNIKGRLEREEDYGDRKKKPRKK